MLERRRLGRLRQRLCRFTTYTAHTSDPVASLIVCTYVVRIQRLGRSLPATWSLASLAVPSPYRSMYFECIVSRGVVDEPGVCPHVPRRMLARVGQDEGLEPQRFMPAYLPCVSAVFGLAVRPPIYVQQDRFAEPQVGITGVCRSGSSKNCTYYTVPCPTCKHVSGQSLGTDVDVADVGLGGSSASGHAAVHTAIDLTDRAAPAEMVDSDVDEEDADSDDAEEDASAEIPPGQPSQAPLGQHYEARRCQNHQHEFEFYVCLPSLIDMCVSRRRCRSSDPGPGSATWSLIHTQQPVELTFVDGFRLSLPRFWT